MSRMAPLLDKVENIPFPNLTFPHIRNIASELVTMGASDADIERELTSLTSQQQDTLMKVLYCCLEHDSKSSSTYFRWHAKLYALVGPGSITRVLTEKKV
ncbi:ARP2/3 complex subunit [Trypanosoma theileri]|uniref:Actin-related protein 2/3 complex subunit 5 n=1 Tax=Trypanosoma theileri TaxID=67003 RepID=A0A1X0P160_9TRYP|nr:ARP2/3 complex subunit [Trypanosoma theileri]ORC90443.1 ARP2/3 complex subunit [Trypanosoma theileri]